MPGQSYLVVDSALSDSVLELSTVIDHYNPGTDYVSKVNSFVIESEATEEDEDEEEVLFKDEIYNEIATTTQQYLLAFPEKELEPISNLIIYIFSFVPESFETLTKTYLLKLIEVFELLSQTNKKKNIKSMAVLSILSNVFNFIEPNNYEFKNSIFEIILQLIESVQNSDLLSNLDVKTLLVSRDNDQDLKLAKANLVKYSNLIKQIDELKSLEISELIINEIDSSDIELISKYLKNSLNSTKLIDLSSILKNSKISSSSSTEITELISIVSNYQTLPTPQFQSKLSSSSITDLNKDLLVNKNRYLTLSKLSLSSNESILSYDDLLQNLSIGSKIELEKFLIFSIQKKIIQGKLSQSDENIKIYKILLISNDLTKNDWTSIKNELNDWKLKLKEIKSLIDSSKKKIKA